MSINAMNANGQPGGFHGLGALDKALRKAAKLGLERLPVTHIEGGKFIYAETGKPCAVPKS